MSNYRSYQRKTAYKTHPGTKRMQWMDDETWETYRADYLRIKEERKAAKRDYKKKIRDNVFIDPITGCWVWLMSKNNLGYGFISYKGKTNQLVHRVSYTEFKAPIPDGHCVRHKCDNAGCCNPNHLTTGTHQENTADMIERGRAGWQKAA